MELADQCTFTVLTSTQTGTVISCVNGDILGKSYKLISTTSNYGNATESISQTVSGNASTLNIALAYAIWTGGNGNHKVKFSGENTVVTSYNDNDGLGIRFACTYSTGFMGMEDPGSFWHVLAMNAAGKVGSLTPMTSIGSPAWRNVLDDGSGNMGIGVSSPTAKVDINGDTIRLRTQKTPASATATGNAGDWCHDANYLYICTATNTWKRAALSTW